mgnify:CR=1 FL=1
MPYDNKGQWLWLRMRYVSDIDFFLSKEMWWEPIFGGWCQNGKWAIAWLHGLETLQNMSIDTSKFWSWTFRSPKKFLVGWNKHQTFLTLRKSYSQWHPRECKNLTHYRSIVIVILWYASWHPTIWVELYEKLIVIRSPDDHHQWV